MSNVLVLRKANGQGQSPQLITPQINQQGAGWQMNLPGGQGVTGWGRAIPAMGAAWGALNALSSDDQGDLISTIGNAGMRGYTGYQAASQALGPAQQYAHQFTPAGRRAAARAGLANAPLLPLPNAAGNPQMPMSPAHAINPNLPHNVNASGNLQVPPAPNLGYTNFADSTAGSTSGNVAENNVDAAYGIQSNNDPQTNLSQYGAIPNTQAMHDKSSMISGQEGENAASTAIENLEGASANPHVTTGQDIMGESKRQLTLEEATRRATGKDTKQAMFKSRRPWSYY
tara:strand:- start:642 stop:1499 length:858 start_codon:yes stop_codon:yes gene_type:complete